MLTASRTDNYTAQILMPTCYISSSQVQVSSHITTITRIKIFHKNSKDVRMAQKVQKQEGMSCGEVFATTTSDT